VEGNKQIIQVTRAINDRKILYANMADDYVAEHGQLDAKFMKQLRQYGEDHPIFSEELKKKISPAVTPLPTTLPDVGGKHVDPNTGTTYEVLPAK
jgi:hypothetical protein